MPPSRDESLSVDSSESKIKADHEPGAIGDPGPVHQSVPVCSVDQQVLHVTPGQGRTGAGRGERRGSSNGDPLPDDGLLYFQEQCNCTGYERSGGTSSNKVTIALILHICSGLGKERLLICLFRRLLLGYLPHAWHLQDHCQT